MTINSSRTTLKVTQAGDEDPLDIITDMWAWQFIWARAVARSWKDPDSAWTKQLFSEREADVREAFMALGFMLPPGFKLIVKPANDRCKYNKEAYLQSPPVNGWEGQEDYLGASVVMYVPPAPENPQLNAIALTDYNANGQNYPFTF